MSTMRHTHQLSLDSALQLILQELSPDLSLGIDSLTCEKVLERLPDYIEFKADGVATTLRSLSSQG